MKLLTRDEFREGTFKRDKHLCVICKEPGKDAHHIIERRLFDDGGYYLDNGATLCEKHHLEAEMTTLSVEAIREASVISNIILPEHLYHDNDFKYDKWGNIILSNGKRIKGELFFDESVQKIMGLGGVLDEFIDYVKYPRTFHMPWSEKTGKDDRILKNMDCFENKNVVCTIKLDGENTTMYRDYIHARSLDSKSHPSHNWVKGLWSKIGYEIPEGWRICGENVYAKHTIEYNDLDTYFYVFSIWNEKNECLNWNETKDWCELLNLKTVPIFYTGIYNEKLIKESFEKYKKESVDKVEGYTIRITDEFTYGQFKQSIAKFVSSEFEIVHGHWQRSKLIPNKLK